MKLLTADEIAEIVGVSSRQVSERLSKQSGFPDAIRIGGVLRWNKTEVEHWISKQRVSPAARRSSRRLAGSKSEVS